MLRKGVWIALTCMVTIRRMWPPTEVPENMCPLSLPRSGSNGVLFVRLFVISGSLWVQNYVIVLSSGPGSGFRPVESEKPVRFPVEPFFCGPHLHVVEHETYAICLNCQRLVGVHTGKADALKGRPCKLLLRKKRAKFVPGFANHVDELGNAGIFSSLAVQQASLAIVGGKKYSGPIT
eukprot:3950510-Amphidinium_carterae.1